MEEKSDFEKDLASIRQIMERSVKFVSLSGVSGILAGIYASAAAFYIYRYVFLGAMARPHEYFELQPARVYQLVTVGIVTLAASLITGWYFSYRKANRLGLSIWDATSKRLLLSLSIPLAAGGIFSLLLLWHGYFLLVAPVCLLFYGLALVNASQNLFVEIRYLGYCEIVLGLISTVFIGYGLLFWAIGFGVLHIVYGVVMYRKYDA